METLFKLAELLSASGSTEAAKLRPAFFLAQECTGVTLYEFKLGQGLVLSDQLEQDLSQLASGGFVVRSNGSEGSGVVLSPSAQSAWASTLVSGREIRLRDLLLELLHETNAVLEAAATSQFFLRHGLGAPEERLTWYRTLPKEELERAQVLITKTAA